MATTFGGYTQLYPMRYAVGYNDQGLVELLHRFGARVEKSYNSASWIIECDPYIWDRANQEYRYSQRQYQVDPMMFQQMQYNVSVTGVDYGHAEQYAPSHNCLAEKCSDSQKDFYDGVLNYHKMSKPDAKVHECGNTMCLIEQYKNVT